MVAYFIADQESAFYNSPVFSRILNFIQQNPKNIKMKELKGKLTMAFEQIRSISEAINKIENI